MFYPLPESADSDDGSASASVPASGSGSGFEASGFNDIISGELPASGESDEEEPTPELPDVEQEPDSGSGSALGSGSAEGLAEGKIKVFS